MRQWLSTGDDFAIEGHLVISGDIWIVTVGQGQEAEKYPSTLQSWASWGLRP